MPVLEKTQSQVLATQGVDGVLPQHEPTGWKTKVREMRFDPTIALLRGIIAAPLMTSEWSVTSDDPKYKPAEQSLIDAFVPRRHFIVENVLRGLWDFGWQPFEMVWDYDLKVQRIILAKMKPLLQDITDILVDPRGNQIGLRNTPSWYTGWLAAGNNGIWTDLNYDESMVFSRDVEGTNWYGVPEMRCVETPYESWKESEVSARRFDKKIAGAHWVVYYPIGYSEYNGRDRVNNFEIASEILRSLEASGRIAIPLAVLKQVEDLNAGISEQQMAWKIEIISANTTAGQSFVDRQKYQDALKARGLGVPERAVFEGQFGTKAEAEAHADFAIDLIQMRQTMIIDQLNDRPVKYMLRMNYGESFVDHVRLIASPLSDVKRAQLRRLYEAYFQTQVGQTEEADRIDWAAVTDELGYPVRDNDMPGESQPKPAPGGDDQPAPVDPEKAAAQDAAVAALGEYQEMGQRNYQNNMKRIKSLVDDMVSGKTSPAMTEQYLYMLGLSPKRVESIMEAASAAESQGEDVEEEDLSAPVVE